jgi:hypothetical protein
VDAVERGEFTSSVVVVVVTMTDSFVARGGEAAVATMDAFFLVAHNWYRSARDREVMLASSGFVWDVLAILKVREVFLDMLWMGYGCTLTLLRLCRWGWILGKSGYG